MTNDLGSLEYHIIFPIIFFMTQQMVCGKCLQIVLQDWIMGRVTCSLSKEFHVKKKLFKFVNDVDDTCAPWISSNSVSEFLFGFSFKSW